MGISFDPAKNARNIKERGLSFADFTGFDADPVVIVDDRFDYGEVRWRAFGRIDGKGHCLVYVETQTGIRIVSFRRPRKGDAPL